MIRWEPVKWKDYSEMYAAIKPGMLLRSREYDPKRKEFSGKSVTELVGHINDRTGACDCCGGSPEAFVGIGHTEDATMAEVLEACNA